MVPFRGEVIELSSSPEPETAPAIAPLRRSSRARSTSAQPPNVNVKRNPPAKPIAKAMVRPVKGKGKAKEAARLVDVIELTDSEEDDEPFPRRNQNASGSSSQQPRQLQTPSALRSRAVGGSSSNDNIPAPAASDLRLPGSGTSKKRQLDTVPLFLRSPASSDEENDPTVADLNQPLRKANKGKGKAVERPFAQPQPPQHHQQQQPDPQPAPTAEPQVHADDAIDDAMVGDFAHNDVDFWNRPFPFMMDEDGGPGRLIEAEIPAPAPVPAAAPAAVPAPTIVDPPLAAVEVAPRAAQPLPIVDAAPVPVPEPVVIPPDDPPADPRSSAIAQILEIIPNVCPEHLLGLVDEHLPARGAQTVEHVLGLLFESDYPKAEKKNKGKRKSDVAEQPRKEEDGNGKNKKPRVDWESVDRPHEGGPQYFELAMMHLQTAFPYIPKPYIRKQLISYNSLYAPTFLSLFRAEQASKAAMEAGLPLARKYVPKTTLYNPSRDRARMGGFVDEVLDEERLWCEARAEGGVVATVEVEGKGKGKEKAVDDDEDEELEDGEGIECQCCFAEYRFDKMVQCPETHLFCNRCILTYAETQLGSHNPSILCMHPSDCRAPFPVSELQRILSPKLMSLYERLTQQKELEQAGLEGLEECPFCEWKCVMEVGKEQEKLFRCGNEEGGCGVISCRECKKVDHLPKSCKEMEEDRGLDGRHAIEEAMSKALMRNCPKCKKVFIKESGCNKMTCTNCHTLSCYVCKVAITGYDHFDQRPAGAPGPSKGGKCPLWDQVEQRHADEVKAAAEKAMEEYKRDHPDIEDEAIKVDLPVAPPPPAPPQVGFGGVNNAFNLAALNAPHHPQYHMPFGPGYGVAPPGVPYVNVQMPLAAYGQMQPGMHNHLQPPLGARAVARQAEAQRQRLEARRREVAAAEVRLAQRERDRRQQAMVARDIEHAGARYRQGVRAAQEQQERQARTLAFAEAQRQQQQQHEQYMLQMRMQMQAQQQPPPQQRQAQAAAGVGVAGPRSRAHMTQANVQRMAANAQRRAARR